MVYFYEGQRTLDKSMMASGYTLFLKFYCRNKHYVRNSALTRGVRGSEDMLLMVAGAHAGQL